MSTLMKRGNGYSPVLRSLLSDFFESENLLMDEFFRKDWVPAVNVSENEKYYEIELAAPGLKRDDFHVKITDGVLTISSEKRVEKEQKDRNYTRKEFNYTSFSRSFTLPENAKEDEIKANYENGLLKLSIAKTQSHFIKAKEIAVA